jgi:hypothetical protein
VRVRVCVRVHDVFSLALAHTISGSPGLGAHVQQTPCSRQHPTDNRLRCNAQHTRVGQRAKCAGAYASGALGSNVCPAGSVRIETEAACRIAAGATGKTVPATNFVESDASYPRGCYYQTKPNDVRVAWFNSHPVGAGESDSQLLCATVTGPTGAPHASARVRGVWHCMVWHCRVLERTTRCSQHTFALMEVSNGLATILTMVIVDHVNMCSTAVTANAIAAIPTTAAPMTASPTAAAPDGTLLDRHSPPLGRAAPAARVALVGYHCGLARLLPRHREPVGSILATCSRGSGGTGLAVVRSVCHGQPLILASHTWT